MGICLGGVRDRSQAGIADFRAGALGFKQIGLAATLSLVNILVMLAIAPVVDDIVDSEA